jgi:hypothetical protein
VAGDTWNLKHDDEGSVFIFRGSEGRFCNELFDMSLHADSTGRLYINSELAGSTWVSNEEAPSSIVQCWGLHVLVNPKCR